MVILGAVMALSSGVLGIFEQLHLFEGLMGVSKPINDFKFFSNDLKSIGHLKGKEEKDQYVPLSHILPQINYSPFSFLSLLFPNSRTCFCRRSSNCLQTPSSASSLHLSC